MNVICKACGHAWTLAFKYPIPVDQWLKEMRKAWKSGCPQCGVTGGKNILVKF